MKLCTVENCDNKLLAVGLCNKHYHQRNAARRRVNACACGCGELTEYTYKHGHHTRLFTPEEQARRGRMNDGSAQRDQGSKDTYRKVGGVHEHRTVAAKMLGRPLLRNEIVHHKNHNKRDNRPENLEVMTQSQHINLHRPDLKK